MSRLSMRLTATELGIHMRNCVPVPADHGFDALLARLDQVGPAMGGDGASVSDQVPLPAADHSGRR